MRGAAADSPPARAALLYCRDADDVETTRATSRRRVTPQIGVDATLADPCDVVRSPTTAERAGSAARAVFLFRCARRLLQCVLPLFYFLSLLVLPVAQLSYGTMVTIWGDHIRNK